MPTSKHRRKGKLRPRRRMMISSVLSSEPEDPQTLEENRLIRARLRELHGEEREWTNAEWDEAVVQLVAEGKVRPDEDL
jgi:hypothetical protein